MPSINILGMGGCSPKKAPHLLPNNLATQALDCWLTDGTVVPARVDKPVSATFSEGQPHTIYRLEGQWLTWAEDVDVVRGFSAGDPGGLFFFTGAGLPQVSSVQLAATGAGPYPGEFYDLGIEAPVTPLTIAYEGGVGVEPNPQLTYYLYTWVDIFGGESRPSPLSIPINRRDDTVFRISGWSAPPKNAFGLRIYRSSTGTLTDFYFVVESAVVAPYAFDRVRALDLGAPLQSQDFFPPPKNMRGLVGHPNGFLAGFVDNQLLLSEVYQPHAFPPEFARRFDSPIVALGVFANTIVVMTTAWTYLVTGSNPRTMAVETLSEPYPCVSKRSVVNGDLGVFYAAKAGLVRVTNSGLTLVSKDDIDIHTWATYRPENMFAVYFNGRYYGWSPTKALIYDVADRATGAPGPDRFIERSAGPTAAFVDPSEGVFVATYSRQRGHLWAYEQGDRQKVAVWASKEFRLPYLVSFAAIKLVGEHSPKNPARVSVLVKASALEGGGFSEVATVYLMDDRPQWLPRVPRSTDWKLKVTSSSMWSEIHMATSMTELSEGAK